MNKEIKRWGEKFIVLMVVLLLIFPFDLPAKKKGARLEVTKKDGVIVIGELLQVKDKSLLLMTNSETGATIDINDINTIKIKKSNILKGIGSGILIGGGIGVVIGLGISGSHGGDWAGFLALVYGIICAIPAGIIGGLVGAVTKEHKKIQVEGKSQFKIDSILKKLKKKARIK